jgi:very-short-patch-repair endonuclease
MRSLSTSRHECNDIKPMDQRQFSRHLRKTQNTYEELLWQLLRNRKRCNRKFRRQHPIGVYVADFYCAEDKLVIEIDGRDHFTEQGRIRDEARDRFMHLQGIRILRFTGKQVETETDWVLAQISQVLDSLTEAPHPPTPSPRVRGEGE